MNRNADCLVRVQPLFEKAGIPVLVEPLLPGLQLHLWAAENRQALEELLSEHGALLFRGFRVQGTEEFGEFVSAASEGGRLAYIDRSTPRVDKADRIYTATTYPREHVINMHNEGTYWRRWPRKLFFYCKWPAAAGGQTPIADVSAVLGSISPPIREEFDRRQVMYVRNYNSGLGLRWQEVFQTDCRQSVEEYCRENDIEFEWRPDDRLRTRQVRPAVRVNPGTGNRVWFNHAAFFNVEALESDVRKVLLRSLEVDDLPYNTYFGDGGPIEPGTVREILDVYKHHKVVFDWKQDDVLLLDNMQVAHGREAYSGEREVLVAMTEPHGDCAA